MHNNSENCSTTNIWTLTVGLFSEHKLADFTIYVGSSFDPNNFNSAGFSTCTFFQGHLGAGETSKIECGQPVTGRYVVLQLTSSEYLHICDFQVYGETGRECAYWVMCSQLSNTHVYQGNRRPSLPGTSVFILKFRA